MRLVITYTFGDGYTFSATETVPVEYESAEAFAVDFEALCRQYQSDYREFEFAGHSWSASPFFECRDTNTKVYIAPDILTVDEWFEIYG